MATNDKIDLRSAYEQLVDIDPTGRRTVRLSTRTVIELIDGGAPGVDTQPIIDAVIEQLKGQG